MSTGDGRIFRFDFSLFHTCSLVGVAGLTVAMSPAIVIADKLLGDLLRWPESFYVVADALRLSAE